MVFSIYFADKAGNLGLNNVKSLTSFIEEGVYSIKNGKINPVDIVNYKNYLDTNVGFFKRDGEQSFIILITYETMAFSKPIQNNWGLYIKNILTILQVPVDEPIYMFITNNKNTLKDTQTVYSHSIIERLYLEDLTNTYTKVQVI
ncbi:HgNV_075 [Dikerogammarus haemobaphes nudivirus]|nr:HgNV_075 [Dikerogammarus haemobaphes nudivirus]